MAGQTPIYGLPYQTLTDPPHGPDLGQDLAEAVEAELTRIDAEDGPRGYLASTERTADVTATTVEILADAVTFTNVAGRRTKLTWDGLYTSSAAGDNGELRLRYAAGASVTNSSTQLKSKLMQPPGANSNLPVCWVANIAPNTLPAGVVTVGVFIARTFGSGTHRASAGGSAGKTEFVVEDNTTGA